MGYFKKKKGNEDEISADELLEQLKADLDQERGASLRGETVSGPDAGLPSMRQADGFIILKGKKLNRAGPKAVRAVLVKRGKQRRSGPIRQWLKLGKHWRKRRRSRRSPYRTYRCRNRLHLRRIQTSRMTIYPRRSWKNFYANTSESLTGRRGKQRLNKIPPERFPVWIRAPDAPADEDNGAASDGMQSDEEKTTFDDEDFSDVIAIFQKKHPGGTSDGTQTFADEGFLNYVKSHENEPDPELHDNIDELEEEDLLSGTAAVENETENLEGAETAELGHGEPEINGEFDQTDLDLMIAFGMEEGLEQDDPETESMLAELEEKREERYQKMLDDDKPDYTLLSRHEYVSRAQNREVFTGYKKTYGRFYLKLIAGFVLLVALFLYENHGLFGWQLLNALDPEVYPVVFTLVDLQLVLFIAALSAGRVWNGFKNMCKMRPTPESLTGVLVLFSILYSAAICFVSPVRNLHLFNFPVALCAFLHLIYAYMLLKREIMSFKVVSSKKTKFVLDALDDEESVREREMFGEYISDAPDILKIKRTAFVDGFVRRTDAYPRMFGILRAVLPIVLLLAALCFTAGYLMSEDLYRGISVGYLTLLLCMPVSAFLSFGYPLFRAAKLAFGQESAIIGDRSVEEYADASVISFEDKEVFPSYGIKVRSVKVYGSNRIDNIIYNAASVYSELGGPACRCL